uniref:RNA-directed DNA polymerase n=1 Tax=Haemonchus contortus TaxID=6289 RepID=A0A7I4YDM0_HAECO
MSRPKDAAQERSFLGLINHYGAFVPKMRQLRAPLDALLKKGASPEWNSECETVFERAKEVLTSDLPLTHYDPKLPITVAAHVSDYGIGAVISHRYPDGTEKANYHASCSLTDAEKNYGQIERKALPSFMWFENFIDTSTDATSSSSQTTNHS